MSELNDKYVEVVTNKVKAAQENNDIPMSYRFTLGDKHFVCDLPRSVMEQKHLIHARNEMLGTRTFEAEAEFIKMIARNTTLNDRPLNLNDLDYGEIEVLKTAYIDELLFPLSQGGDKTIEQYMKAVVGQK